MCFEVRARTRCTARPGSRDTQGGGTFQRQDGVRYTCARHKPRLLTAVDEVAEFEIAMSWPVETTLLFVGWPHCPGALDPVDDLRMQHMLLILRAVN